MNRYGFIGQLFEEEPIQWGLRGDPYLWRKMQAHFSESPLPANAAELVKAIEKGFLELSDQLISHADNFHVMECSHGGMSSGIICPEFWRMNALPLLHSRYQNIIHHSSGTPNGVPLFKR
jgi:hypothetical protein